MYSCFQTLPDFVIDHIVCYMLADNRMYQSQSCSKHQSLETITTSILSLSHRWRKVMLSYILRSIKVCINLNKNNFQEANVSCQDWPYSAKCLTPDMIMRYSKHVNMYVDFHVMLNWTGFELLSEYQLYEQCFEKARFLKVNTYVLDDKIEDHTQKLPNLNNFLACLQKMMPNIKTVELDLGICFDPQKENIKEMISHYITKVLDISNHVKYSSNYAHIDIPIVFGTNSQLTYLEFTWDKNFRYFSQAARQHRKTLQELVIKTVNAKQLSDLFYMDNSNEALVYTSLKSFALKSTYYDKVDNIYGCALEIPPFPVLENIEIKSMYPFADDKIFHNNSLTLKSLRLLIDGRIDEMIHKSQGFANGSFKALTNIELYQDLTLNHRNTISLERLAPFLTKVKTHVSRLSIFDLSYPGFNLENLLAPHILLCQNLHYLSMPSSSIGLSCLLDFMVGIPGLKTINCQLAHTDPLFEVIPESRLPNHVHKHYFQNIINRCIEWQIETNPYVSYKRVAKVIILLKIAFPTFKYSVPNVRSVEKYVTGLRECASIPHFAEYAKQILSRLQ